MPFNPYEIHISESTTWKPSQAGVRQALNGEVVSDRRDREALAKLLTIIGTPQIQAMLQNAQSLSPEQRRIATGFKSLSGMDS